MSKVGFVRRNACRHNGDHPRRGIPMTTPTSRTDPGVTGWLRALDRLRPTPEPHRGESLSREQALLMLRCDEEVLDALCDRGLPHAGQRPQERYDTSDLMNLALSSGSNRSLPELGAAFIARVAGASPPDWVAPHRWKLHSRSFALHGEGCGEAPSWSHRRPAPESFGGSCLEWREGGELQMGYAAGGVPASSASAALSLTGRLAMMGEVRVVRSATLRGLYREVLETIEYMAQPRSLGIDLEAVQRMQAGDCAGLSVLLEHECRRAGYTAVARRGYLLGLLGIGEHCWVEVLDDDERVKVLDPTLPIVARHGPRPTPAFTAFCLGSISNRLLPFDCSVAESIVEHECGGVVAPTHSIVAIEPDKE
jgi:hypothetical protein